MASRSRLSPFSLMLRGLVCCSCAGIWSSITVLLLGVVLVPGGLGQISSGSIAGVLTDQSGAGIGASTVVLTENGTGASRTVYSDASGAYAANALQIGTYSITAEKPGFAKVQHPPVAVELNQTTRVDLVMPVGSESQTVEVTGAPVQIDPERSSLGTVETEQRILDLPLNGRNFIALTYLSAGVTSGVTGTTNNGTTFETGRANQSVSVNGLSVLNNNFLLDGLDNNEFGNGAAIALPPPDALEEFRTEESSMSADFGRGGAAISVALKSGTNQFHGDAWEFLRNNVLDARNYFDQTRTPFKRNQFGATLGGPLRKNHTFFFVDYQGTRIREAQPFVSTVPTAAERGGDFTALATQIYDPYTTDPVTGARQLVNPANPYVIPANRINTVGQNIVNLFPQQNLPGIINNYLLDPELSSNENSTDVRIDHDVNDANHLFGHYTFDNFHIHRPAPLGNLGGEFCCPSDGQNKAQTAGLGYTRIFSPKLLNDLRGGASRYIVHADPLNYGLNLSQQAGIPNANRGDLTTSGLSYISIAGFSSIGDSQYTPEFVAQDVFQLADTLTLIKGHHSLKFGGDYLHQGRIFFQTQAPRGTFDFNGTYTENLVSSTDGNGLADLLLGTPDYSEQDSLQSRYPTRYWQLSEFVRDDWHILPNLTLNLGLRYDTFSPAGGRIGNFDLNKGIIVLATGSNPRAGVRYDHNDWGPRVGFAWAPYGHPDTLVKSAFGIFYGPQGNGFDDLGENPPYLQVNSQNFNALQVPDAGQLISAGFPPTVIYSDPNQPTGTVKTNGSERLMPRIFEWNLTVQQQIGSNLVAQIGYVGTRGYHLWNHEATNLDQPLAPLDSNFSDATGNFGRPYFGLVPNVNTILPMDYAQLGFAYHSLQASLNKRYSNGVNLLASYTWAKTLGNTDGDFAGIIQNAHDVRAANGPANPDLRNRFVASGLYALPFGRSRRFGSHDSGAVEALIGQWQLGGLFTAQSGQVFTGALSFDDTNTGSNVPLPDQVHDPTDFTYDLADQAALGCTPGKRTLGCYYNQAAFVVPALAPGQVLAHNFGDAPVNGLRGPGFVNLDFSALKTFNLTERYKLQFRAESFDLFNHANFDLPGGARPISLGSPSFVDVPGGASITATLPDSQRELQFALKVLF
jgi:hypothetical protein